MLNLSHRSRQPGFTLVELVVMLTIMGILALMAMPRFFETSPFTERGYFEEALSAIAFAHNLATSSGCDIKVDFSSTGYAIEQWASCSPADHSVSATVINDPSGKSFTNTTPSNVTVGSLQFYFDRLGRPRQVSSGSSPALITSSSSLALTIESRTLQVEPETGFVHSL